MSDEEQDGITPPEENEPSEAENEEPAGSSGEEEAFDPEAFFAEQNARQEEEGDAPSMDSAASTEEVPEKLGEAASGLGGAEDLLDQSMIDALMQETQGGSGHEMVFTCHGERVPEGAPVRIDAYDFRNPVFLTEVELRQVRVRHEQFIRYLGARLSVFLRMDFQLGLTKLYTCQYNAYRQTLPDSVYIGLFRFEQLSGVGLLTMSPRMAMTITDRMLGGRGHSVREERYLTEIEENLMEDVMDLFLEEWCKQWDDTMELNPSLIGSESSGRYLQTAPHDAIMLILSLQGELGDCQEEIQLAIPYYTIEPVIKRMQANSRRYNQASAVEKSPKWREAYAHINVPVTAEWDAFEAEVGDILTLQEGDVLELPADILAKTRLRIVNTPKFLGEVGLEDGKVAVKITESIRPDPAEKKP